MKDNKEIFGREYFDGNKGEPWLYKNYKFEEWYPWFKVWANILKEVINPKRVLDVGCAKGFLVLAFKEIGIEAYGVDISEYAILNAPEDIKSKLYRVDLLNKDSLSFFENEYFDLVCCLVTLEYLKDHKNALNEMRRVLKRGGGLFLTTVYKRGWRDKLRVNVHDKGYWIKEFESNGFKFESQKLNEIIKIRLKNFLSYRHKENEGVHLKIGRKVISYITYMGDRLGAGKNIIILWDRIITNLGLTYGILYFTKT